MHNLIKTSKFDVIIIGAGAAGLMCAIESGKRGRSVLLIEHNDRVGKKIRISGGGRCNFTNIHTTDKNFLSKNPHFAKSALARFTPDDFLALVQQYKIAYHEKKLGQLFCDNSAQDIINMLKRECDQTGVTILLATKVLNVTQENTFRVATSKGEFQAESFVIATGGLSIPPLGATNFGYAMAKQFGIKVQPCRPGLVPLTFNQEDLQTFKNLSGISFDAVVCFENIHFHENILFTHKGLSGPAILQISSYWQPDKPIHINLFPQQDILAVLKDHHKSRLTLKNLLNKYLPARFTEVLCAEFLINKPLNQYVLKELQEIANLLNDWQIIPGGTEGYAKAEVTVGGVDTNELSSKTMEVKKTPGLYFIGENVDVTGHLGGFNFQWAWCSGYAAGQHA